VSLDARLPKILNGEDRPADAAERLLLARLCQQPYKQLNAAAARFYTEAFAADSKVLGDLRAPHGYSAACAAALAGCGRGTDAAGLDDAERSRLRRQALTWLRAQLAEWHKWSDGGEAKPRADTQQAMTIWLGDTNLARVRGPTALAGLPEAERRDWEKLWQEVEELGKRAAPARKGH
jgi:hypothetical protein